MMTEYLLYMWFAWLCGGLTAYLLCALKLYVHSAYKMWFMLVTGIVCVFAYSVSLYYGSMAIYMAVAR